MGEEAFSGGSVGLDIPIMNTPTPYSVNYWGSHPEAENDDCFTGSDFATAEEALAQYLSDESPFPPGIEADFMTRSCAYVEVSGPDLSGVRQTRSTMRAKRRELA